MNSRKWVRLFLTTLLIGGLVGLLVSFFVKTDSYTKWLQPFDLFNLVGVVVFCIGLGFLFSVLSQTGFFAFLFINQFGLGIFRSFWPFVQVFFILFVLFDLLYFPYQIADGNISYITCVLITTFIFIYGWIIAKVKVRQTNKRAFIPTLFLMIVLTTAEWIPGLREIGTSSEWVMWMMIFPLLVCNTYQLLMLHKINQPEVDKKVAQG